MVVTIVSFRFYWFAWKYNFAYILSKSNFKDILKWNCVILIFSDLQ